MTEKIYGLSKLERISKKDSITHIFVEGKKIKYNSIKLVWIKVPKSEIPIKVLFTVPKKLVKLAVNRNKLRRCIKEAYRLNNHNIKQKIVNSNYSIEIALVYSSTEHESFETINHTILQLLNRLELKID
jgi:ribonuclease P protein component